MSMQPSPRRKTLTWLVVVANAAVISAICYFVVWDLDLGSVAPDGPIRVAGVAFAVGATSGWGLSLVPTLGRTAHVVAWIAAVAGILVGWLSNRYFALGADALVLPYLVGAAAALVTVGYVTAALLHARVTVIGFTYVAVLAMGVVGGVRIAGSERPDEEILPEPAVEDVRFAQWKLGDVHVHAAGDRDLVKHPDCETRDGYREGLECARELVKITAGAADQNGVKWLILVEHGAWLGGSKGEPAEKGEREWEQLRKAVDEAGPVTGIRMLMGEELGTAGFSFEGHFSAYQTPRYIPNGVERTPDISYVEAVEAVDGWGAINHPFEGGNIWRCWFPTKRCGKGAVGYAEPQAEGQAAFRAIEISNGGRYPSAVTTDRWDQLLTSGYRVWAVGGSDAHTRSRGTSSVVHAQRGLPNIHKVGRSRTFVRIQPHALQTPTSASSPSLTFDVSPTAPFDSTDPNDPVRQALFAGAAIASNGPLAVAIIGDVGPGQTFQLTGGEAAVLPVGVTWPDVFSRENKDPELVRVTYSEIAPGCDADCPRPLVVEREPPAEADEMTVPVSIPPQWERAYVRAEVIVSGERKLGAFVNPIFVVRRA